jgi:hypothetical protein
MLGQVQPFSYEHSGGFRRNRLPEGATCMQKRLLFPAAAAFLALTWHVSPGRADVTMVASLPLLSGWLGSNCRAVGWSQDSPITVRVSAAIANASQTTPAMAYLSTGIGACEKGPDGNFWYPPVNIVYQTSIVPNPSESGCAPIFNCIQTLDGYTTLFSGLQLKPGQYYLTITNAWWAVEGSPTGAYVPGVSVLATGLGGPFAVFDMTQDKESKVLAASAPNVGGTPVDSTPYPEFYYRIIAAHSSKLPDDNANSCAAGTPIIHGR